MKVVAAEIRPVVPSLSNASHLEYMPWFAELYVERLVFEADNALVPECLGRGFAFNHDTIRHPER